MRQSNLEPTTNQPFLNKTCAINTKFTFISGKRLQKCVDTLIYLCKHLSKKVLLNFIKDDKSLKIKLISYKSKKNKIKCKRNHPACPLHRRKL